MPELPEVETTRRGIIDHVLGKPVKEIIVRNPNLRWPVDAELAHHIEGKRLTNLRRRGKYLLLDFANGSVLWHLGMSGSLRIVDAKHTPRLHDHIDMIFSRNCILRYHDPRRFGSVIWSETPEQHSLLAHLGPEPLSDEFDGEYLYLRSRKIKQAVKTWIMNSQLVVGVGNIYANESLFNAGIHPLKPANKLSRAKCDRLVEEIKSILTYAIGRGGTTLRDFVGGDGQPGYFALELKVYGRGGAPCQSCGKALTEKRIGQRTTVYCTQCQR